MINGPGNDQQRSAQYRARELAGPPETSPGAVLSRVLRHPRNAAPGDRAVDRGTCLLREQQEPSSTEVVSTRPTCEPLLDAVVKLVDQLAAAKFDDLALDMRARRDLPVVDSVR